MCGIYIIYIYQIWPCTLQVIYVWHMYIHIPDMAMHSPGYICVAYVYTYTRYGLALSRLYMCGIYIIYIYQIWPCTLQVIYVWHMYIHIPDMAMHSPGYICVAYVYTYTRYGLALSGLYMCGIYIIYIYQIWPCTLQVIYVWHMYNIHIPDMALHSPGYICVAMSGSMKFPIAVDACFTHQ